MKEGKLWKQLKKQLLRSLSWTLANERADMSSKTNTFAYMQKCRIFNAVRTEERQNLQRYRS